MRRFGIAVFALLVLLAGAARAQTLRDALLAAATRAPDLAFPDEPSSLGFLSSPKLALYKPDGAGPFPALVIHHQCGGLRNGAWQNLAILGWAKEAVARGYVALVLDSLGPRGVDTLCYGVKKDVNFARGVRDALQGAAFLRKLPYVDGDRIALAGFSWGAMAALLSTSATWNDALTAGTRFRAVVSFYPGCFQLRPPGGTPYYAVQPDIDTPVLVLMGDADTETPPADCTTLLEPLKAAGKPVEWHVYPGATHCWDCANLNGFQKVDARGKSVTYRYSQGVHKDSADRLFEFVGRMADVKR